MTHLPTKALSLLFKHPSHATNSPDKAARKVQSTELPVHPRPADLNLLIDEAELAWQEQRGAWAQFGSDLLLGYEYRACIKLGARDLDDPAEAIADAYQRVCVAQ
ncbi:hypothetical protein [Nonomuraea sp. SYSU D8015]|uniref:hypothetical protein n=1 Tax=Nonomuraea sp. SYSU D8015 TaxID=2593644 RepID=UPI0016613922|nr:hypothetical protein [Nonomuraea sp. SYSU D8015]